MPRRHLDSKKPLSGKLYTENDGRFPRQVKYRKVVKSRLLRRWFKAFYGDRFLGQA